MSAYKQYQRQQWIIRDPYGNISEWSRTAVDPARNPAGVSPSPPSISSEILDAINDTSGLGFKPASPTPLPRHDLVPQERGYAPGRGIRTPQPTHVVDTGKVVGMESEREQAIHLMTIPENVMRPSASISDKYNQYHYGWTRYHGDRYDGSGPYREYPLFGNPALRPQNAKPDKTGVYDAWTSFVNYDPRMPSEVDRTPPPSPSLGGNMGTYQPTDVVAFLG